jgi:hypothetical protein
VIFNTGDIVVCVDPGEYKLTLGKQYIVLECADNGFVYVKTDLPNKKRGEFFTNRFIDLKDWREQQINKIINEH